MGCFGIPSMLALFLIIYFSSETLVSLCFSLNVHKTIYKIKSRPLITSPKTDMFLLLLKDFVFSQDGDAETSTSISSLNYKSPIFLTMKGMFELRKRFQLSECQNCKLLEDHWRRNANELSHENKALNFIIINRRDKLALQRLKRGATQSDGINWDAVVLRVCTP